MISGRKVEGISRCWWRDDCERSGGEWQSRDPAPFGADNVHRSRQRVMDRFKQARTVALEYSRLVNSRPAGGVRERAYHFRETIERPSPYSRSLNCVLYAMCESSLEDTMLQSSDPTGGMPSCEPTLGLFR